MLYPTHNFALIPDKICAEKIVDIAQKNFAKIADDYLLASQKAMPHITICHVNASDEVSQKIWLSVPEFAYYPNFLNFKYRENEYSKDNIWAEFTVQKTQELLSLQRQIFALVHKNNATPLTLEAEAFAPHLTLARIFTQQNYAHIEVPNFLNSPENKFCLALCRSDKIGQAIEVLN